MLGREAGLMKRCSRAGSVILICLAVVAAAIALIDAERASRPALPAFPGAASVPASQRSRVALIVMENKEYGRIIGSPKAPFTNALAHRYGLATRFYGVSHPSLPNYIALTTGSTFGIHTDCTDCRVHGRNLIDQLASENLSWKGYIGGAPRACYRRDKSSFYVRPIDPFVYLTDVARNPSRCSKVVPFAQLAGDLGRSALPDFSWISPNLCDSGHSCGVARGDRFLHRVVPGLLEGLGPRGILFVIWDEGNSKLGCCGGAGGGHVPVIVAGPQVRPGGRSTRPADHFALLRTIESAFGLKPLRHAAAASSGSLRTLFTEASATVPGPSPERAE